MVIGCFFLYKRVREMIRIIREEKLLILEKSKTLPNIVYNVELIKPTTHDFKPNITYFIYLLSLNDSYLFKE